MHLFINPPFGTYLDIENTTSIQGSFTLYPRSGLFKQILKTLRYSSTYEGWINKIGLRNKGIDWAVSNFNPKHIYSIAILNENEIDKIVAKIPNNMNVELNVSCPNTDKEMINTNLSKFLHPDRDWCIIKLSPVSDFSLIDNYYKEGFRQFHCSNTIPISEGGLSGKSIIPYNEKLIKYIKNKYEDTIVIGGGGITTPDDVLYYKKLGADHFSISTVCFNPVVFYSLYTSYVNNTFNYVSFENL